MFSMLNKLKEQAKLFEHYIAVVEKEACWIVNLRRKSTFPTRSKMTTSDWSKSLHNTHAQTCASTRTRTYTVT